MWSAWMQIFRGKDSKQFFMGFLDRAKYLFLLSALSLTGQIVAASPPPLPTDTLTPATTLDTLTITSRRTATEITASAPTFTLDARQMTSQGVTDIADALHRLPGINLRDYGGAGGMKTVSVRGLGASHTGVVYDGLPLSDARNGRIDLSRYAVDNVDNLSLIVGDNADIFIPAKAAASSATLSIETAPEAGGNQKPDLHANLKLGQWGLVNPYIQGTIPLSQTTSLGAIADYRHADNNYPFTLRNGSETSRLRRNHNRLDALHAELTFTYRPAPDNSSLILKTYYYDIDRQLPGQVTLYNPKSEETLRDRTFFTQATWRSDLSSRLSLRAAGKFTFDATYYHDLGGQYPGGRLRNNYYQQEYYLTSSLLYKTLTPLSFSYSIDYSYNRLNTTLPGNRRPCRHSVLQSVAARWQKGRLLVMGRALLSIYDNRARSGESAKDATRLSPSLSLSYRLLTEESLFLRLSYKNIFRMPTFSDSYFLLSGSNDLKPETTDQWNAGLTWQHGFTPLSGFVAVTADAYINRVKDLIVAMPRSAFVWTMVNLGRARAAGVDLTLTSSVEPRRGHRLLLTGNYSYQRVAPRTDPAAADYNKQVAYTPRHSGALSLCWENPFVDVTIHGAGASEKYGVNTNLPQSRIAGYMEWGLTLRHEWKLRRCRISLRGDIINLFDKSYEVIARYPMPGRSFAVAIGFRR